MNNRVRKVWEEDGACVNAWLSIPSPVTAELTAQLDFDSLTIDLQHGLNDYSSALNLLQAIRMSDATPMARVPWLEPGIVMKLLDAGALGLICPMVNTREQAERFVGYARYAPDGERSVGPTRAVFVHGADYLKNANENVITLAMIETEEGLANVEEIASTPGLTGVYVGPSDLSLSLGFQPKLDHDEPTVVDAIKRIRDATGQAGIRAGIHCASPDYAKEMVALGYDLVTLGSDIRLYVASVTSALQEMRS